MIVFQSFALFENYVKYFEIIVIFEECAMAKNYRALKMLMTLEEPYSVLEFCGL